MRREAEAAKSQPAAPPVSPPGAALPAIISPVAYRPQQEVLPPVKDEDVTRTAFRRAMRKVAQQHAARAIEVLAKNLDSQDPEIAAKAANDVLKWSGLDKLEIEGGAEALSIAIIRFKDTEES